MNLVQAAQSPWYGTDAWLVGITLGLLWLFYVIGKIRRGRRK